METITSLSPICPSISVNGNYATKREKAGKECIEGTWHLWLTDGKRITNSEKKLDEFYTGWRLLPIKETTMDIYKEAERLVDMRVRNVMVVFEDGRTEKMRLFKSATGRICKFRRRSSRYGYELCVANIKSISPIVIKKSPEDKWKSGWNKVIAKLRKSGLWSNLVEEIELALKIGYERIKNANTIYWNLPNDEKQLEVFKKDFPELIQKNEQGYEFINTSLIWSYSKLPRVKKMRFERGIHNNLILDAIRQAMNDKRKYSCSGKYGYDIDFEYHPEKQRAWYSEEYVGCGNGHYYIAISSTHALFQEDD